MNNKLTSTAIKPIRELFQTKQRNNNTKLINPTILSNLCLAYAKIAKLKGMKYVTYNGNP